MGRLLLPLVAGLLGALMGAFLAGQAGATTAPAPWGDLMVGGFALLTGLLMAVIAAWLLSAVDTNHLAVTPLRHLVILICTFAGALIGAGVYYGLGQLTGPLEPRAAKVLAAFVIGSFALAGFDQGRRSAETSIY